MSGAFWESQMCIRDRDLYAFLRFLYEGGHRKDFMRIMDKLEPDLTRKALVSEIVSEEELMCYYRNNVEMRGQIRKLFSKLALAGRLQTHLAIRLFLNEIGYDSYLKKKSRSYVEYEDKKKMAQTIQEVFASYQRTKPLDEFILQCQEKEDVYKRQALTRFLSIPKSITQS